MFPKKRALSRNFSEDETDSDNIFSTQISKKAKNHSITSTRTIKSPSPTPTESTQTLLSNTSTSDRKSGQNLNANLSAAIERCQKSIQTKIRNEEEKISEITTKKTILTEELKVQKAKAVKLAELKEALVEETKSVALLGEKKDLVDEIVGELHADYGLDTEVFRPFIAEMREEER